MAFDVTRQELLKQANDLLRLYKQTRDKKYKDEEIRLRKIASELESIVIGGGTSGVTSVIAGAGITIDPLTGTGDVTINADTTTTVRTVDSYLASEGQTDFTITASSFDFVDVYVNGARLIPTEYSISSNVLTLNFAAELDDEIALVSYYTASLISLPKEYTLRHDFVSPYSYCGKALVGSLETQSVWTVTRIEVLNDGSVSVSIANNVNWIDRYTHTYIKS